MMKGTRNIGRAILALALVGAVGFSAIACKTDVDGNGGNGGNTEGTSLPETDPETGLFYQKSGNAYILKGRDSSIRSGDSLTVPDTYEELPVTEIADNAFPGKDLTKVTIGNKVEIIGNGAFYGNKLAGVTFGNKVEIIGDSAFGSNELAGELSIPDSVVSIGQRAFSSNELTKVTFGNKVETIGDNAFYGNMVTTITIGANVVISSDTAMGSYGSKFLTSYNGNGKKKGTYTYAGNYVSGAWTLQE